MKTLSLNHISANWQSSLIPSALEDLCRGIERENERLNGALFIILSFRRELDYDGFNENIELLRGFSKQNDAIVFVDNQCARVLSSALAQPCYGNNHWSVELNHNNERFVSGHQNQFVKCVHFRSFKIVNGSDYDCIYYQIEVLRIETRQLVGSSLFTYLSEESEWVSYLIKKGKE